nr:amidase [Bacillus piscicola]
MIRQKELSPVDITDNMLNKIETQNNKNNAFITVMRETAMADAKKAEKDIVNGNNKGPLHGVPLALKDNISVKDVRCTNGSMVDESSISQNDAAIVKQLQQAGAIIIGKTNLDEYANHMVGKNKHYGTIQNPLHADYSVGGSSGGSAVSVAAHLAYGAIGTDTSGSVRVPAACCGIVGLKPTYNLLPVDGVTPLSWSLDHMGILSKDCQDLSVLFHALAPGAKQDTTYLPKPVHMNQLTIGIPETYFFEKLDKTVETKIREVIDLCVKNGAAIKKVNIPKVEQAAIVQEKVIGVEASYVHARELAEHKNQYEEENYEYFKHGATISHTEYIEALKIRERMSRDFQHMFNDIDILLTPTLPITAPKLTENKKTWGEDEEDILMTLSRYTGPFNVSGLPALQVPVGFDKNHLSIGLQIVGDLYSEEQLIAVGDWIHTKMI